MGDRTSKRIFVTARRSNFNSYTEAGALLRVLNKRDDPLLEVVVPWLETVEVEIPNDAVRIEMCCDGLTTVGRSRAELQVNLLSDGQTVQYRPHPLQFMRGRLTLRSATPDSPR